MSTIYQHNTEEQECNFRRELMIQDLGQKISRAKLVRSGRYLFALFEKASFSIYEVAEDLFDVSGTLEDDGETKRWEDLSRDDLEHLLISQQEVEFPNSVIPKTPNAGDSDRENPPLEPLVDLKEYFAKDQINISEPTIKSHSLEWLCNYLRDLVDCQSAKLTSRNTIELGSDGIVLEIQIEEKGTYHYKVFLSDELISEKSGVAVTELIKFVFNSFNRIEENKNVYQQKDFPDHEQREIIPLMDLKELSGLISGNPTPKKSKMYGNKPVELNEDCSGKILQYHPIQGAIFMDKKDLPSKMKFNYDEDHGVVLTVSTAPDVRPSRWYSRFHRA